jgi:hypothetical protein
MNPVDYIQWKKGGFGDFYQRRMDYDGSDNLIYVGIAPRSVATSAQSWKIWKLTYSGTNLTSVTSSAENAVWDSRLTETYG